MKHKIKSITLTDGKQIFYPTDEELKKLNDQIEKLEIIEYLTKKEWDDLYCTAILNYIK